MNLQMMHVVKRTIETSVKIKINICRAENTKTNCNVDQLQRNFGNSQTVPPKRKKDVT